MRKILTSSFIVLALAGFLAGCALGGMGASAPGSRSLSPAISPLPSSVSSFAVLAGPAVTLTNAVVNGDVGIGLPSYAYTETTSTVTGTVHKGDQTAIDAYKDLVVAYGELAPSTNDNPTMLTGTLASVTLAPGVYAFDAAATLTGVLTLDAQGKSDAQWIFKIGYNGGIGGTGALTGTGFTVVMANNGDPCNVYWWVHDAATMTDSNFQGTVLAGADITVTRGTFNGEALAIGSITLTGATLAGCATPRVTVPPVQLGMKVTGGGQIAVDSGMASFGFNARPDRSGSGASGEFNYVNLVTGLHINGKVNYIAVSEENTDGSPKTVLFSGTYDGGTFVTTVQDRGEPGVNDQLGVTVSGSQSETESMRVISNGNIQFHK